MKPYLPALTAPGSRIFDFEPSILRRLGRFKVLTILGILVLAPYAFPAAATAADTYVTGTKHLGDDCVDPQGVGTACQIMRRPRFRVRLEDINTISDPPDGLWSTVTIALDPEFRECFTVVVPADENSDSYSWKVVPREAEDGNGSARSGAAAASGSSESTSVNRTWLNAEKTHLREQTIDTANNILKTVDYHYATFSAPASAVGFYPSAKVITSSVVDPAGLALTTLYSYYPYQTNFATAMLKSVTNPDGSWEYYTYDERGKVHQTARPWLNSPATPAPPVPNTGVAIETITHNQAPPTEGWGWLETSSSRSVPWASNASVQVESSTTTYQNDGYLLVATRVDSSGATTITATEIGTKRLAYEISPQQIRTHYAYSLTAQGESTTRTVTHTSAPNGTPHESTQDWSFTSADGLTTRTESRVCTAPNVYTAIRATRETKQFVDNGANFLVLRYEGVGTSERLAFEGKYRANDSKPLYEIDEEGLRTDYSSFFNNGSEITYITSPDRRIIEARDGLGRLTSRSDSALGQYGEPIDTRTESWTTPRHPHRCPGYPHHLFLSQRRSHHASDPGRPHRPERPLPRRPDCLDHRDWRSGPVFCLQC